MGGASPSWQGSQQEAEPSRRDQGPSWHSLLVPPQHPPPTPVIVLAGCSVALGGALHCALPDCTQRVVVGLGSWSLQPCPRTLDWVLSEFRMKEAKN